jgi:CRP-like cAMP-binding protein
MLKAATSKSTAHSQFTSAAVENTILATLPEGEFSRLRPHLTPVLLRRNDILHDALCCPDAGYFIEAGIVSRVVRTVKDGPVEAAVVGRFGFVGVSVALGTMQTMQRTIVRVPGRAYRIDAQIFRQILQERPRIREHLLRYVQLLMVLKAQMTLCNARHEIDQRVARWILLAQDRIGGATVPVTHSLIASALGVRRAGVSETLARFEAKETIRCSRGSIGILDIDGLRRRACECEEIVRDRFRILRDMPHHRHFV